MVEQPAFCPGTFMQLTLETVDGIDLQTFDPGTALVVETHHSRYRLVVLWDSHFVLMKGGAMFPDDTVVRLDGAVVGSALRVGWIVVGLRMEMRVGSACIRTSPVCSVTVESVPPSNWRRSLPH
jgi:hypothetical protein